MKENEKFSVTGFSGYRKVEDQYPDEFIKGSLCVKISETPEEVVVCASESRMEDVRVLDEFHHPKKVRYLWTKESDFAEFIGSFVDSVSSNKNEKNLESSEKVFSLEEVSGDAPAVNIINSICLEALRKNASDIHLQPSNGKVLVRFRLDGVLQTMKTLDGKIYDSLVSRIKVMAGLNIMETRLPQDGRMGVALGGRHLDFRVSLVPVAGGESIVLRLFNYRKENISLESLGFSETTYEMLKRCVHIPYGMVLVTGPTGSGKTTTLHSLIQEMDLEHLKVITIEDPVERVIDGVDQIQVNESIGLTFESILRRVLRQDPDVIMVGEIRDSETASLAVRAALTGHMILSTLHTNDSVGAISRLENLGVSPYLIGGVLRFVLAQRLVRRLCVKCKGTGCTECGFSGYNGRTAVSEMFEVDETIASSVSSGHSGAGVRPILRQQGFRELKEDAISKVKSGITDMKEIQREALA